MLENFTPDPAAGRRRITRRRFLFLGGAAGLGVGVYAGTHARHELQVISEQVAIRNLPDAFAGFRIVQISDVHLHEYTEAWFFERVVDAVNNLNPDLVLYTGDLISDGPRSYPVAYAAAGEGAEIMERIRAPRFAIMGNHDALVGAKHVIEPLEAHGTQVLDNAYAPIERKGERFWLCGTKDVVWSKPDLNKAIPEDPKAPVLLMVHEPDYADYVSRHPRGKHVDLMISGHTHGGQVRLPWIGPLVLPVLGRKYVHSMYQVGAMKLYVNQGIGTTGFPLRLNCVPEITEFTLVQA